MSVEFRCVVMNRSEFEARVSWVVILCCRTLKLAPQFDHAGPLMVPAGSDKFKDIGRPRGVADGNVQAGLQVRLGQG